MTQPNLQKNLGKLIIVDDEAELMGALIEMLSGQGYETAGFTSGSEALKMLAENDYDVLLTDLMMPEMNGIELLRTALEIDPNMICIIMTGQGTVQTAVEAMKTGAFDYILKPFKLNSLLPILSRAIDIRRLRMDNLQLRETVAMHELGKAISYTYDLNAIVNKITQAALQQCDADEVSVMLPTPEGHELYVAAKFGGPMDPMGQHIPINQGIAGWVAQNHKPVTLYGAVDDHRFTPLKPRNDIRSAVSMPMLAGGKLVGVLNVNITRNNRPFTLGQLKALNFLISIVSPILENVSLYIKIQQAEEKFRSIFENASEGIFQLLSEGKFITANAAMANILGYESPQAFLDGMNDMQHPFYVHPEDRTTLTQTIEKQGFIRKFETQLYRKDGVAIWVSVSVNAIRDQKGALLYEGLLEDITVRKQSESRQLVANKILDLLNRPNEIIPLIENILLLLKEQTDIEAIGIRLRDGEDFPYFVAHGFDAQFLERENHLCTYDDENSILRDDRGAARLDCLCGKILRGQTIQDDSCFTKNGSFWTNSLTKTPPTLFDDDFRTRMRNCCSHSGYESMALIPLRSGDEIFGLLQLNDQRTNRFSIETIEFLEGIGASIGIAVARQMTVKTIVESEEKYRLHFENINDIIYSLDEKLTLLSITPSVEKILGYLPQDLIGKSIQSLNLLTPAGLEKLTFDMNHARKTKVIESSVYEFIATDGEPRFVEVSGAPIIQNGEISKMIFVARDITERKAAEALLVRERNMVDRIMKTSPAAIVVVNRESRFVFANRRAEELFGLSKKELLRFSYTSAQWRMTDYEGNPFPEEQLAYNQVMQTANPVYGVSYASERADGQRIFLLINGAPIFDEEDRISEVVLTIDDITNRRQAEEKIQQGAKRLERSMADTIKAMSMVVETRDPYTAGHQNKVARLAVAIAQKMNLSAETIKGIEMAGIVHDIGKIYIPSEILSKPSKLSDLEMRIIQTHAQAGYEIIKDIELPWPIARIILEHHERINGCGYPRGLSGDQILPESKIIAIADVVDAMASHRPYRPAVGLDIALDEIEKNMGIIYDADAAEACLQLFRQDGFQLQNA